ncbi:MAG: asparaginase domain-containing protein, partial [Sedimentibacter sp.]
MKKNILLIATGGTIASKKTENGLAPGITSEELLGYVPEIKEFCNVDTIQLLNIDSTNIQPEYWVLMTEAIEKNYEKYDGFVISHGTDTMAYT